MRSILIVLLLIPSALFLWHNSDIPQFGLFHDDGLYYVSAKSLAEGSYRIESLPGRPSQTKYPPLYPMLLSLAWRIDPQFPQNLRIAAWISWAALPLMLWLLSAYFPRIGISGWRMWLSIAAIGCNSYVIFFASALLSELWFTALLVGALLLAEQAAAADSRPAWALAAGAIAGLAYLTRTAGIVLFASAPLYLFMRGRRRNAALFVAGMLPFIAGWMLWSRAHMLATSDQPLVYYIDYLKYEFYNVHLSNIHLIAWKNLDGFLWGLGYMVIPKVTDSPLLKILAQVLAVAMICGVVRLVKAGRATHYAMYAAGTALMLAIWYYPPNERFVLPLVPLGFAGLLTEMERFACNLKTVRTRKDRSQRVAGFTMAGALVLIFVLAFVLHAYIGMVFLNDVNRQQRKKNSDYRAAYSWMQANLPASASVLTRMDPVLFLYTGRSSMSLQLLPKLWYEENRAAVEQLYTHLSGYARLHGIEYFYYSPEDGLRDLDDEDEATRDRIISSSPDLMPISRIGATTVYSVREPSNRLDATAPAGRDRTPSLAGR